jgi:hypothetical protein
MRPLPTLGWAHFGNGPPSDRVRSETKGQAGAGQDRTRASSAR